MVKISLNLYECEWCGEIIEWKKRIAGTPPGVSKSGTVSKGKKRVAAQLSCPKCSRYVSQKTTEEIHGRTKYY